MNKNIFIKSTRDTTAIINAEPYTEATECDTVSFPKIIDTIPSGYYKERQLQLYNSGKTEWRWRFYQMGDRSFVDISKLDPTFNIRMFVNRKGEWYEDEVPKEFDQYVVREYYYYSST